ncbi:MAG: coproporphyrinogen-III oxidase family protein, partial [Gemmatimonadaceae bacterium]
VPVAEYLHALGRELELRYPARDRGGADTLYFGGGTPSLLGADGVARMMDIVTAHFAPVAGTEVTLEANPEDVTPHAVRAWRDAGINRVSLGAQSFDANVLAWMHRGHSPGRIEESVRALRGEGIENVSIDLIFAVPDVLARDWRADVERAVALAPPHLSFYGLTVEPATPLGKWRERGDVTEAPEERFELEFLGAHELLAGAGYEHYEVSNYGRPGHRSRHNSSYWDRRPYAGVGPSAHAFDGERRRWNVAAYAEWAALTSAGSDPIEGAENLSDANRRAEEVYLGLRTTDGLAVNDDEREVGAPWIAEGWATLTNGRLRLTPSGWLRLDSIAASLGSRIVDRESRD